MEDSTQRDHAIGIARVLHRGLARRLAVHAGIRVFRFYSRALRGRPMPPPAGIELKMLAEGDVLRCCADLELDLWAEKVRAAFLRGDACAGALEAGRLVGYCWFAFGPLPHIDDVWVDFLHSKVMWLYKSFVRPSHRGRGIAPALYRSADALGARRGCEVGVICVESHNLASISAAARSGHTPAGYAGYRVREQALSTWYSAKVRRNGVQFYLPSEITRCN